jgi:hypothetical protein
MIRGITKLSVVAILLISPHFFAYGDSLEANLLECRAIIIDVERLSCLDDAIAALQIKELSDNESDKNDKIHPNTVTPLGEKYIQKKSSAKAKEHGFSMVKAYKNRKKHWVFELDNGQRWQQNEPRYLPSPKVFPVKVMLSEGKFGGYNLKAKYLNKTVKVKRIH